MNPYLYILSSSIYTDQWGQNWQRTFRRFKGRQRNRIWNAPSSGRAGGLPYASPLIVLSITLTSLTGYIYRHLAAGPPVEGLYAHYDVTEELGKGSFATVMKAMSKANGHWYAVKMIHNKNLRRSTKTVDATGHRVTVDASAALHKEVQILQRLQHPNICQLKEVFYEENYIRKSS